MSTIRVVTTHGAEFDSGDFQDSGIDLRCLGYRTVENGEIGREVWFDENPHVKNRVGISSGETIMLLTGIKIQLPHPKAVHGEDGEVIIGYDVLESEIRPRSGLSLKQGSIVKLGTVDNGYTGEYGVIFYNHSSRNIILDCGDRVAQIVFNKIYKPTNFGIEIVDKLIETNRSDSGFGSSGVA